MWIRTSASRFIGKKEKIKQYKASVYLSCAWADLRCAAVTLSFKTNTNSVCVPVTHITTILHTTGRCSSSDVYQSPRDCQDSPSSGRGDWKQKNYSLGLREGTGLQWFIQGRSLFGQMSLRLTIIVCFESTSSALNEITVEAQFKEVPGDWGKVFVISRVRYIKSLDITNMH